MRTSSPTPHPPPPSPPSFRPSCLVIDAASSSSSSTGSLGRLLRRVPPPDLRDPCLRRDDADLDELDRSDTASFSSSCAEPSLPLSRDGASTEGVWDDGSRKEAGLIEAEAETADDDGVGDAGLWDVAGVGVASSLFRSCAAAVVES